jgi:hypothetical protein
MLMRTDPFRELDRLTQQVMGTAARPAAMPMDACRPGVHEAAEPRKVSITSRDAKQVID